MQQRNSQVLTCKGLRVRPTHEVGLITEYNDINDNNDIKSIVGLFTSFQKQTLQDQGPLFLGLSCVSDSLQYSLIVWQTFLERSMQAIYI